MSTAPLDFQTFFEKSPALLLVLDRALHIVAATDAYLAATMTTRREVVGRYVFDVFPDNPGDSQASGVRRLRDSLVRCLENKAPDRMAVQKYDIRRPAEQGGGFEERFWSPVNVPVLDDAGSVTFLIHRVEDLTDVVNLAGESREGTEHRDGLAADLLAIEAELRRQTDQLRTALDNIAVSEAKFRGVFSNSVVGISLADLTGQFIDANQALLDLLGYSREELLTKSFADITHQDDLPADRALKDRLVAGEIPNFAIEKRYLPKSGHSIWVRNMVSLVEKQCRDESCFVMVTVDLTQQREAEDALRNASARLLQSQDEERRRIARELHDDTAQNLAAALLHLNTDEPRPGDVRDARQLIGESYRELRTVSYLLHPPWLDESGFEPAVEWYVNGFAARTGIQCDLSLQLNNRRAPNDLELALFRIVQEALTNVHRHSKATRCEIHVQICGEAIDLQVRDNGTGIPPSLMARIRSGALLGVGLVGMNERVRQLGGRMEISSDGNGTSVRVTAPLS